MANLENTLKTFVTSLNKAKKSNSTILAYRKDLLQFYDFLSEKQITDFNNITPEVVDGYVQKLETEGIFTLKTVSRKINSLRTFFKYLLRQALIKTDPTTSVKHPKIENKMPRVLEPEEYLKLLNSSKDNLRLNVILTVLLQTGLRIGELARLKIADLKLNGVRPKIRIVEYASCPEREIIISDSMKKLFQQAIKIRSSNALSQHLLTTKTGRNLLIRNIRSAIDKQFERCGIEKATVNDLRNTFIVCQLKSGVDPKVIADYVGHQRLTSTKKFVKALGIEKLGKGNEIVAL